MDTQKEVRDMYNSIPFPDYGDAPLEKDYVKAKQYIDVVLGFNGRGFSVYQDKDVLDAGCGTGRESMYIASQGGRVTAFDMTEGSLEVAELQAGKHDFKHPIKFVNGSVLDMPFEDETFDIVLSSGVIHHTLYPEKAFSELARVLKPNGYLILFVYNTWAHVIPNLRREIVSLFAGKDIHKRAALAKKLYPFYTRKMKLASVYDEFSHPHKSEHGISEVLSWFSEHGIQYEGLYPRPGFKGFYETLRGRFEYVRTGQFRPIGQSSRITPFNRITSSVLLFLLGFRAYSGGYRFIGVKQRRGI